MAKRNLGFPGLRCVAHDGAGTRSRTWDRRGHPASRLGCFLGGWGATLPPGRGERSPPLKGVIFPTTRGQCWVSQQLRRQHALASRGGARQRGIVTRVRRVWWTEAASRPPGGPLPPRGCPCPGDGLEGVWLRLLRAAARPAVQGRPTAAGLEVESSTPGGAAVVRSRESRVWPRTGLTKTTDGVGGERVLTSVFGRCYSEKADMPDRKFGHRQTCSTEHA